MATKIEEVTYSLTAPGYDCTLSFPRVDNVAYMRLTNIDINDLGGHDYLLIQVMEGGYTTHSAIRHEASGNMIMEPNICLKLNMPGSSSIPSNWESYGTISVMRSAIESMSLGNSVRQVKLRVLTPELEVYRKDAADDEVKEWSLDLTLGCASS